MDKLKQKFTTNKGNIIELVGFEGAGRKCFNVGDGRKEVHNWNGICQHCLNVGGYIIRVNGVLQEKNYRYSELLTMQRKELK